MILIILALFGLFIIFSLVSSIPGRYAHSTRLYLIDKTKGYFSLKFPNVTEVVDLAYIDEKDPEFDDVKHRLNVYFHTDASKGKKLPVVVFIHGGGWIRGDRHYWFDTFANFGRTIASLGYVAVVPSYRLSASHPTSIKFPIHAHDAAKSLLWVKNNIDKFGGDPSMIFLTGHSAGAHLATLLVLDAKYCSSLGLQDNLIKGVIGLCGVYDVKHNFNRFLAWLVYFRHAFSSNEEDLEIASPFHHSLKLSEALKEGENEEDQEMIHKAEKESKTRKLPPFLLINAEYDLGLERDAELLVESLKKNPENRVEHVTFKKTSHGSLIGLSPFARGKPHPAMITEVQSFISSICNKQHSEG